MKVYPYTFREYKADLMSNNTSDGDLVLEVGCGKNNYKNKSRGYYVGIDVDHNPDVKADACHLPFAKNTFNKVFMFDVIEHIKNAKQFLKECSYVLKPDGKIYLTTPNIFGFGIWDSYIDKTHVHHFYAAQFKKLLHESGFKIKRQYKVPMRFYVYLKFLNKLPLRVHNSFQRSLIYEVERI